MADGTILTIKRPITVRAVVTPTWKEEAEREISNGIANCDQQLAQLEQEVREVQKMREVLHLRTRLATWRTQISSSPGCGIGVPPETTAVRWRFARVPPTAPRPPRQGDARVRHLRLQRRGACEEPSWHASEQWASSRQIEVKVSSS